MLYECKKFGDFGLKVEAPKKVGSKVVIFDVENEMTDEELANEVYAKNLMNAGVTENEFKEKVRIISRTDMKGANVSNVVMEVSKRMSDVLVCEGRVYVKWRACKVKEFINVLMSQVFCFRAHDKGMQCGGEDV